MRRKDARAEVHLNRRLAPGVYLGARPLRADRSGGLSLARGDRVVDWLVHMRRLPAPCMLDAKIQRGEWTWNDVDRIAQRLCRFFLHAPSLAMTPEAYIHRFRRDIAANIEALRDPSYDLDQDLVERVRLKLHAFLARYGMRLGIRGRRVVDAHGDLRPEHICTQDPPVVIDCIAFNASLRRLDPADDLAFLVLECERLGAPEIGRRLFDVYRFYTGDRPGRAILRFYRTYRACLRAKLAVWHIDDASGQDPGPWRRQAHNYLRYGIHDPDWQR